MEIPVQEKSWLLMPCTNTVQGNKQNSLHNVAAIPRDLIESELFGHEKELLRERLKDERVALSKQTAVHFLMKSEICLLKRKQIIKSPS